MIEYVSRGLGFRGVPRVLARSGTSLLSQWVEGQQLSNHCEANLLRQCGALQGLTHSRTLPGDCPSPHDIESRKRNLKSNLETLVRLEVLGANQTAKVADLAESHSPESCASGFTYGDFCADNIVRQPSGDVCFVDTETLDVQPYDYDLARTWYRWPMNPGERQAYLGAYREHRPLADFEAHFPYWAIIAIVGSAVFRARRGGPAATTIPVQRLNALIGDLERGSAKDAIYLS
jgi:Ser/Thr protein kinase RdoA (MazF antagonist)